ENGRKLTPANVAGFSPVHRRCGTTFLCLVILSSIIVYTFIPSSMPFWSKFMWRILLLPVIAGISYEILRLGGRVHDNFIVNLLIKPGLWIQKMTTAVPKKRQIEVAIVAVKAAVKKSG
ncbi:DUF1385 domain-containing protein, partial [Candidatus Parvarchaeota archaeon]|nr:DUF1385 domain-containing protein [Candidatus Parvarchaeota archaeon]